MRSMFLHFFRKRQGKWGFLIYDFKLQICDSSFASCNFFSDTCYGGVYFAYWEQ